MNDYLFGLFSAKNCDQETTISQSSSSSLENKQTVTSCDDASKRRSNAKLQRGENNDDKENDDDDDLLINIDVNDLSNARKLNLACLLYVDDYESKEDSVALLQSIILTEGVGKRKGCEGVCCAYACELLCFIYTNQCLNKRNVDRETELLDVATIASSSGGYSTPFSHFLLFINKLWNCCHRTSVQPALELKGFLWYGYLISSGYGIELANSALSSLESSESFAKCLFHLQRSAYGGLIESQEILVLLWSKFNTSSPLERDNARVATFIAWSFNDEAIDRLLLYRGNSTPRSNISSRLNLILQLTGFVACNDSEKLWLRRLKRQTREQIQRRLATAHCYNCLSLDCSLDDCTDPEMVICKRCKLVRYCSLTCRMEHWQSKHEQGCAMAVEKLDCTVPEHVPQPMIDYASEFAFDFRNNVY